MARQLIAVDAAALDGLIAEVRALRQEIQAVRVEPHPEWLPVKDYASCVGRSVGTVNRWIADGKVETKMAGAVRMVKV